MPRPEQANVEYWFRLFYDLFHGTNYSGANVGAWLAHFWVFLTWVGYAIAVLALGSVIYATMRLFALRAREDEELSTLIIAPGAGGGNTRWAHIEELMTSGTASDSRQAIIEADIMLGDLLTKQGYRGESIGEQLKQVDPPNFATLEQAWSAHKVRNDIAHQGSAFDLSPVLAQRTIAQYENVFREFKVI